MSDGASEAPDTAASSQITDHPFIRSGRNPFLCGRCSLGEAAHASSEAPVEERPQPIPVAEIDMSEMQEHVVTDRFRCGATGPAPGLSCELDQGHEGLHKGWPAAMSSRSETDMVQWGEPPKIEQDDPIGGGRVQELLAAGLSIESTRHAMQTTAEDFIRDNPEAFPHLTSGQRLVEGERMDQHGPPVPNMERVARGWSILCEANIRPQHVPLMMVWFKLVRESQGHLGDNLDDIEGYAEIMRQVVGELGE